MRVLPVLLILALHAQAQAFADVETSLTPVDAQAARGDAVAFTLTVSNEGTAPGDVTIVWGELPSGWQLGADNTTFTLAPGAQRTVALTLSLGDDATAGTHEVAIGADMVFTIAGQTVDRDQHTSFAEVHVRLNPYEELNDELDGLLPWLIGLVLLLLAIITAVLVLRERPLAVLAQKELETAPPGGTATFRLVVANRNRRPEQVRLAAEGLPPGWTTSFTRAELDLRPRRSAPVEMTVTVPLAASEDARFQVVAFGRKSGRQALRIKLAVVDFTPPEPTYTDYQGDVHPVEDVEGIGKAYGQRLRDAGIETTARLCYEDPMMLAGLIDAPVKSVRQWQSQAQLMKIHGIGPQYAEALARAGVDIETLKKDTTAAVAYTVNAYLDRLETNVLGQHITETRVKGWQKKAKAMKKVKQAVPKA